LGSVTLLVTRRLVGPEDSARLGTSPGAREGLGRPWAAVDCDRVAADDEKRASAADNWDDRSRKSGLSGGASAWARACSPGSRPTRRARARRGTSAPRSASASASPLASSRKMRVSQVNRALRHASRSFTRQGYPAAHFLHSWTRRLARWTECAPRRGGRRGSPVPARLAVPSVRPYRPHAISWISSAATSCSAWSISMA
jgi:hypothetical protein